MPDADFELLQGDAAYRQEALRELVRGSGAQAARAVSVATHFGDDLWALAWVRALGGPRGTVRPGFEEPPFFLQQFSLRPPVFPPFRTGSNALQTHRPRITLNCAAFCSRMPTERQRCACDGRAPSAIHCFCSSLHLCSRSRL